MPKVVKFKSGGINCAGDLYLPPAFSSSRSYPGLVVGHGTAQTRKSLVGQGEFFSRAGYLVLAIDYRSFGESEGEPRGQLFPLAQVEDFRNGVSFLQHTPGVDRERIGIWGTSNSGGTVIYAAAVVRRIFVFQAEDGIRDGTVTGVQTCALPISSRSSRADACRRRNDADVRESAM